MAKFPEINFYNCQAKDLGIHFDEKNQSILGEGNWISSGL